MNKEEAKEILTHNWTRVDNPNYSESELDEAFFMAIEALSVAELKSEFETADTVSREFYEDAVKANIRIVMENRELKEQIEALKAEETIEIKPMEIKGDFHIDDIDKNRRSIFEDIVYVVRCKDCRHRCKEPIYSKADAHWVIYQIGDCPIICKTVSDDDYCSWGERREP